MTDQDKAVPAAESAQSIAVASGSESDLRLGPYCALTSASEPLPNHLFEHLLEAAPDAVVIVDGQGEIILANSMCVKTFGYARKELIGKKIELLMPERYRERHVHMRSSYASNPSTRPMGRTLDLVALKKSGEEFPAEISLSPVYTERGFLITAIVRDVTDRQMVQDALRHSTEELRRSNQLLTELSNLDPLTGTLNRRGMEATLVREAAVALRDGSALAAILIDLDDFKSVNETKGHAAGDQVLKGVAERMRGCLRASDFLARVGGDEFVILMPATRLSEAMEGAQRVRARVANGPFTVGNDSIKMTISCGLVSLPLEVSSLEQVLVHTRIALKMSKSSGKNQVAVGDLRSATSIQEHLTATDAMEILRPDVGLRAVSQPICSLSDRKVSAHELFIRGPAGPLEMPSEIFRVAREHEMVSVVDINCLKVCLAHSATIPSVAKIHVNLLPQTLVDIPVEQIVALFPQPAAGRRYCVELSEQHFVGEPSYLQDSVRQLRNAGIEIAIDDVCFGLSSLEVLILLEPDLVKLDMHYVHGMAADHRKQRAVSRLVQVAAALGCSVIAEGIEREDDLNVLTELGVKYGQGFFWGQPS